jgi:hypothetical protein
MLCPRAMPRAMPWAYLWHLGLMTSHYEIIYDITLWIIPYLWYHTMISHLWLLGLSPWLCPRHTYDTTYYSIPYKFKDSRLSPWYSVRQYTEGLWERQQTTWGDDPNLAILAAILKSIPECIEAEDFDSLSSLLPYQEEVEVTTKTVQEAIAVSFQNSVISCSDIIIWYHILQCDIMLWSHNMRS